MIEQDLSASIARLQRESKVLEIKIKVWKDEKQKLQLIQRKETILAEIERLGNPQSSKIQKDPLEPAKDRAVEKAKPVAEKPVKKEDSKTPAQLERELRLLEIKIKVWKDEKQKLELIRRKEKILAEIGQTDPTQAEQKMKATVEPAKERQVERAKDPAGKPFPKEADANRISRLEREERLLGIKIKVWKEEKGKQEFIKRREAVRAEMAKLKQQTAPVGVEKKSEDTPVTEKLAASVKLPDQKTMATPAVTQTPLAPKGRGETRDPGKEKDFSAASVEKTLTEMELLRMLVRLEKEARILELKVRVWKDPQEKAGLIKRKDKNQFEIDEVKKKLDVINDKKYGEEARSAILRQLKDYLNEVREAGPEIDGSLPQRINHDLNFFVAGRGSGKKPPVSATREEKDTPVEARGLSVFLDLEIEKVTRMTEPGYRELRKYMGELKDRFLKQFPVQAD